jgi:hypothetical protein
VKKRIVIGVVILGILLSPWIISVSWLAGGSLFGKFDSWRYRPTQEFRSTDWKQPNYKYRYSVLDFVVGKIVTNGMSQTAVSDVLGKPDAITDKRAWQYEAKRPGFHLIDFSGGGLLVEFDDKDFVVRVFKNTWVD